MKKYLTLFFITFYSILSFSLEKNYNIKLTVKGAENKLGILAYYYGEKRFVKDSLFFDNKGITFIKGNKNIPTGVYLLAFPGLQYKSFDIILNEPGFSITTDTIDFVKNTHFAVLFFF